MVQIGRADWRRDALRRRRVAAWTSSPFTRLIGPSLIRLDVYLIRRISYLIRLRINRAADLLRHSNNNVTEVALEVGFNDSNYFTRQFKRVVGMSPSRFRTG